MERYHNLIDLSIAVNFDLCSVLVIIIDNYYLQNFEAVFSYLHFSCFGLCSAPSYLQLLLLLFAIF